MHLRTVHRLERNSDTPRIAKKVPLEAMARAWFAETESKHDGKAYIRIANLPVDGKSRSGYTDEYDTPETTYDARGCQR